MDIIQSVFDVAKESLNRKSNFVYINEDNVNALADKMKADGKVDFFGGDQEKDVNTYIEILKELIASSINYCYWYGAHDIRPNGVSSTSMYDNVNEVFEGIDHQALNFENRIEGLIEILSENRYPLLEERKKHLRELYEDRKAEVFANMVNDQALPPVELFNEMIIRFQGFASDIFLKRASLFFIQLYRKFGWYEDNLMNILHVPADYQVPKILRHFNCINYSDKLSKKIDNSQLIKKHSLEEIQIRAATIIACTKLQMKLGWTIADIDTYLWTKRKESDRPFHLTITTDY